MDERVKVSGYVSENVIENGIPYITAHHIKIKDSTFIDMYDEVNDTISLLICDFIYRNV